MEIASKYNPIDTEDKWYAYWTENGFFKSVPDEREPYTIVIPPPNVTGVLHMGHMLNNTIQDILIRRARMQGKNACWVPGTDHASIATEAKVVERLRTQGVEKSSLTRDMFMRHAWKWKEEHGGIILEQLKKLGASCDWSRTCFTMDNVRSSSVIKVFVDLFNKGCIYRGVRMVNWDPKAQTAVSDEEVNYKEVQSKLYYLKYYVSRDDNPAEPSGAYIVIATTRPETILGDTAVCVNPNDDRFRHLAGKRVLVPLINRSIPVIEDDYVDMEFGTGCLKITPAHDINDYEIGIRHNLESIDILNNDGTLSEKAALFVGEDRFAVRSKITESLRESGNLVKVEDYVNKVGFSERTDVPIEPKLSMQWFLKMKELAKPALDAVMNDEVKFHPSNFKNLYRHWMENVKDWCISRQLWWGHRIPVYYLADGSFVVAETDAEAVNAARIKTGNNELTVADLRQDEDVLDTWASSWLWPVSVFDGFNPDNREIDYYYPTNDLVTAPEIIFFWVARMIMAGYEYRGTFPFRNVYFTGIVRDEQGRKMSKSLGNSPDPLLLIEQYGADGVRVGMLLCSPAGNDIRYKDSLVEQGRNFANKIWNAFRLVKSWKVSNDIPQPESSTIAVNWFANRLQHEMRQIDDLFDKYRISEALMAIYTLFWDEFSSWYLEIIKPAYQQPIDGKTYAATTGFLDDLLRLLHPFMPFITEEIWHHLAKRKAGESIMMSPMPQPKPFDEQLLQQFEKLKEAITFIRTIRKDKGISFRETLELFVLKGDDGYNATFNPVLEKMGALSLITEVSSKVENTVSFFVKSSEYFIPMASSINVEEEMAKLNAELQHAESFLESVMKKLNNERFVSSAPEKVVATERQKQADAEAKIKALRESIAKL
ncbi:MAG: valine--tRNA ligase [Cytophagaceae bacterium]|jgi:valyl-tRNA synthetase|nr:valine--tRNA ligase [Cytophagaceae bacterium]